MKLSKKFSGLGAAIFAAAFLGCSDDNSFSALDDSISEISSSSAKSSSSYSYDNEEGSSSSSSSGSSTAYLSDYYYLAEAKTIVFTLTYYKQTSSNWDVSSGTSYTDGDPEVSFKIKCESSVTGSTTTLKTGDLIDLTDTGEWSGSATYTGTVPVGTDTLKFCPSVVDEDILFDDDKSSNYCYYKAMGVGRMVEYEVYELSDYESDDYELEWQFYLY